jgi:hypothetical protein
MTERLLYVFAFAVLTGFLGILIFNVPRVDLAIVLGVTLLLAGRDLFGGHPR